MSEGRRQEFLRLADEHQTPILEDDYAAELRYQGPPIAALKAADRAGQVIYAGTFSKVLFPNLRVGYVVAAPSLLEKMVLAHWHCDAGTALLPQLALVTLLRSGELERHLRRVRKLYGERLRVMLEALHRAMPEPVRWTEPGAGHGVWLTLPAGTDGEGVFREALDQGIGYARGDLFHFDGRGKNQLHLSFAKLPPGRIVEGIERLARVIVRHVAGRRRSARTSRADGRRRSQREHGESRGRQNRGGSHAANE